MKPIYRRIVLFLFLIVLIPFCFSIQFFREDIHLNTTLGNQNINIPYTQFLNNSIENDVSQLTNLVYYYPFSNSYINSFSCFQRAFLNGSTGSNLDKGSCNVSQNKNISLQDISFKAGSGSYEGVIDLKLNETFYFNNNSNSGICLNHYVFGSGSNVYIYLFEKDNFKNRFQLTTNDSFNGVNCVNISDSVYILNNKFYFDRLQISIRGDISIDRINIYIRDINLKNMFIGHNELPEMNITTFDNNNIICMNKTDIKREIFLNVPVFDYENDTIYYSNANTYKIINNIIKFSKTICLIGYCDYLPNYDDLDNNIIYFYNNSCQINKENMFDTTQFGQYKHDILNLTNNFNIYKTGDFYTLSLLGCNNRDKELFFKLKGSSNYFHIEHFLSGFVGSYPEAEVNITFYNQELKPIIKLILRNENNNILNVSYLNGSGEQYFYNYGNSYNMEKIVIDNIYNYENGYYSFYIVNKSTQKKINYIDNSLYDKNIKYWSYKTPIDNISDFRIFSISTISQDNFLSFGLAQPNNITVYNFPYSTYDFYYTDSEHLTSSYKKFNLSISVVKCGDYLDNKITGDAKDLLKETGLLYKGLCVSFGNIVSFAGGNIDLCIYIYRFFVITTALICLLLSGIMLINLGSPYLSFGIGGIVFSLIQFSSRYFFNYSNTNAILYGVAFALSVISLIVGLFAQKV